MIRRAIVLLTALPLIASGASGIDHKEESLRQYEKKLGEQRERLRQLMHKEGSLHGELRRLSEKMDRLERDLDRLRLQKSEVEGRIKVTTAKIETLETAVGSRKRNVALRLRDLYMWGPPSYFRLMATAEDPQDFRRRRYLVRRWIEQDRQLIGNYRGAVADLAKEETQLKTDEVRLQKVLRERNDRHRELEVERESRTDFLAMVRGQQDVYRKSISELEQAAKDLQRLIETLRKGPEEENSLFARMKGRLLWPVRGKLERGFGSYRDEKLGVKLHNKGLDLRAARGTSIVAVFDGKVVYAGWFVGYGKILILDHGSGYFTLYAHADQILKQVGESASAGDPIASVGDSGSLKGAYLYFELRHKGVSQDPAPWLASGR